MLLGCAIALMRESGDASFRRADQVEAVTGLPVLAMVPQVSGRTPPAMQVLRQPTSTYSESLRRIQIGIELSESAESPKTILFSSATPSEGKSVMVASLARLMASNGRRILVVDCDWRSPRQHQIFRCPIGDGLAGLLGDKAVVLDDILYHDAVSGVDVLTAGNWSPRQAHLLASPRMRQMLEALAPHYDHILLDTAPALVTADVLALSRFVDKVVFVVRWAPHPPGRRDRGAEADHRRPGRRRRRGAVAGRAAAIQASTAIAIRSTNTRGRSRRASADVGAARAILFVTRYFWPELIGSAPFTSDIAEWLAKEGRQMTVLSGLPHYPGTTVFPAYQGGRAAARDDGRRDDRAGALGPAAARLRRWPASSNEAGFLVRGLGALASGRVKRHPVVLALCPSILCVALALAGRQRGGSAIAIVHDIQSGLAQRLGMNGGRLAGLMRWVERASLNRVDLVVVLSQEMKDQLRRIGVTAPIDVVPLWVDTDQIQPIEPAARPAVKVLYSGNLGRKQGLGQVVAMAEQLASAGRRSRSCCAATATRRRSWSPRSQRLRAGQRAPGRVAAQRGAWPRRSPPATSIWCRRTRKPPPSPCRPRSTTSWRSAGRSWRRRCPTARCGTCRSRAAPSSACRRTSPRASPRPC